MLLRHADFEALELAVADAAREVFRKAVADHADETFIAFVLTTYGTGSLGGCSVNTIENHARVWAKAQSNDYVRPDHQTYYKWYCGEWGEYEFVGEQSSFNGPSELYHRAMETWRTLLEERGHSEDNAWPDNHPIYQALVRALERLDNEGVFGAGAARGKALVYLTEYNGDDEIVNWSMERLNPSADPALKQEALSWV